MPTDFLGRIVYLLERYGTSYLRGAGVTMVIALVGTVIGCIIGFVAGLVQTIPVSRQDSALKRTVMWILKLILNIYVEVFRGTPMMAQAMFIYFGSSAVFNINMSMWFAAFFIVSINTGAYMAETVRGGILSIEDGQTEGAKAIGMTHVQTMMYVILPQALRNIMPQIGNNLIINIKDTCVLSIIGTVELFYTTKGVAGANILCGLKTSTAHLDRPDSKAASYKLARTCMEAFQEKNGSVICKELKGVETGTVLRSCPGCVEDAVEILATCVF